MFETLESKNGSKIKIYPIQVGSRCSFFGVSSYIGGLSFKKKLYRRESFPSLIYEMREYLKATFGHVGRGISNFQAS